MVNFIVGKVGNWVCLWIAVMKVRSRNQSLVLWNSRLVQLGIRFSRLFTTAWNSRAKNHTYQISITPKHIYNNYHKVYSGIFCYLILRAWNSLLSICPWINWCGISFENTQNTAQTISETALENGWNSSLLWKSWIFFRFNWISAWSFLV